MAAGRHCRRLSRWTRIRGALTGALKPGADGRHRRTQASAELLVLRGEVTDLRATIARLRDQLAALRADAVVSAATLEAARAHAAAQLMQRTTGSQLQISLLLPLVREAMVRAATPPNPLELDAFPRRDGIADIVAAEKAVAVTAEIDLRGPRHAKVA
jgi:outer membrane murein-binding lipoprotein Lpp